MVSNRVRRRHSRHRLRGGCPLGVTAFYSRSIGPVCAVLGVFGFSFKAILIKLAYAWHPVDALTLLTLRMLFSAPFFVAMAWWAGRQPGTRAITRPDWWRLAWL